MNDDVSFCEGAKAWLSEQENWCPSAMIQSKYIVREVSWILYEVLFLDHGALQWV
jgi:hypothetical protein